MTSIPALPRTRRALLAGGALGLIGVLAACGDDAPEDAEDPLRDLGLVPARLPVDAPTGSGPDGGESLLIPEGTVEVLARRVTESLTAAELDELIPDAAPREGDVTAPDGRAFLLVTFRCRAAEETWNGAGSTARLLLQRDGEPVATPIDLVTHEVAYLGQVPADPGPEDAVLEVESLGKIQQLSLIDGTRVSSDVPPSTERRHIEDASLEAALEASFRRESEDDHGNFDTFSLACLGVRTAAVSETQGWPGEGQQYVAVGLGCRQRFLRAGDPAALELPPQPQGCRITLTDGSTAEPVAVELSERHRSGGRFAGDDFTVWFEVPLDMESVDIQLNAVPFPRRDGLSEALQSADGLQVTVAAGTEESS